jgi:transglutaminase-like putative cysteine protease/Flp pilus assembly protein TadD
MRCFRAGFIFVCSLIFAKILTPQNSFELGSGRFILDGAALNLAASKVKTPAGMDVLVLDEQAEYVLDADGKVVKTTYLLYKVLTQAGTEGWDAVSHSWEPWHEQKPSIRARVITPDNVVHTLDPSTISDSPAKDEEEKTFGDGREVRAPLPAIAPGSIVEEEEVVHETVPFFGAGTVVRYFFGRDVTVNHSRLVLDAPSNLPLRYSVQNLTDTKPTKTEVGGRTRIEFEVGRLEAIEDVDSYLPKDVANQPEVTFSTGASWKEVAEGYGRIVDDKTPAKEVDVLVKKITAEKTRREEKAASILQYLSKEIRYTGVEFGDATIVPHSPAETLKRKYGDCKDKASLAVAMLRAAGIPSYVALLNSGDRLDVEADLPGMGLFDHAIVFAPGNPEIWMDPTDEFARLGQLPRSDQGRYALITAPGTEKLIKVPEASASENRIVEKREFYLAENGPARVVETSEPTGVFESEFRSRYADAANKDVHKELEEYIDGQYLSEKLIHSTRTEPLDLSKQFQLTLEAGEAKRGYTDLDVATVAIRLETLFYQLPKELRQRPEPEKKGGAGEVPSTKKQRTADYQLPVAYTYEWHYHIIPPLGFQAKALPSPKVIMAGPAKLVQEYSLTKDGAVDAQMVFDTGKRRLTAREADALRDKVNELREGQAIFIYFEPLAHALRKEGKMREAFQATRELIRQHPQEAVHHLQRAKALLEAGMGEAAREEARTAVKLEPKSALAQKTLAEILESDLVGRSLRSGSDYEGAEAAFRAAKKLDPEDKELTGSVAILLEYNKDGERYGPGAKLRESTAEYRSLKEEDLAKIGLKNNLAYTLFYSGDFAGAKTYAESLNPQPSGIIVAAETALHGTESGMEEARKRTANENDLKTVAGNAGELLMRAGRYSESAVFMAASATGSNASRKMGLAAMLRKAQRQDQVKFASDPPGIVKELFQLISSGKLTIEKQRAMASRNAQKAMDLADGEENKKSIEEGKKIRASLSRTGFPADVMLDVVLPAMETTAEGEDQNGYKVTVHPPGSKNEYFIVVKEDQKYKILDTIAKPNAVGLEILDRLDGKNIAGARALLDWVRQETPLAGGDDPLAGNPFPRMWTKGKEADVAHMRWAAAGLLVQAESTAKLGIAILEEARKADLDEADRVNITLGLLEGYRVLHEYAKVAELALEVQTKYPESKSVFNHLEFGLRGLKRYQDADAEASKMLKRLPDDQDISRAFIGNAVAAEKYELAHSLGQKISDSGKAEASDLNLAAWNALFTGKTGDQDLELATRAAQMTQNVNAGILHTLACVYAELGKTKEARDVIIQAMDILNLEEPESNYLYALGRIAEQYGENDVATQDYRKIEKPKLPTQIPGSSYRLAQSRLSQIK